MRKLIILLLSAVCAAQVNTAPTPVPRFQFISSNGLPLAGGCLFSFVTGTSTPLATYSDATGLTANPNPVILDANGSANVWLGPQKYRLQLFTPGGIGCASGSQVWQVDGVSGNNIQNNTAINLSAQAAPTCTASYILWADSSATRWKFCNNGVIDTIAGLSTTDTLNNKTVNAGTFTGSSLFSGNLTANAGQNSLNFFKHNQIVWVDDIKNTTMASAFADIQCANSPNNCQVEINSNHNETFTSAIALGASNNSVFQHIHGYPGAKLVCNVTGSGNCFTMQGGAAISGEQPGSFGGGSSGGLNISLASTANVSCVFCVPPQNGGQSYVKLDTLFLTGNPSATVSQALADLVSVNNQPVMNNLYFVNFPSVGMQGRTVSNTGAVEGPVLFLNDWMDSSANTNGQPWLFTSSGNSLFGLNIQSGVANHPGSGKNMMVFNGNKTVANSAIFAAKVQGTFFENLVNGSSIGIKMADVEAGNVDTVPMSVQNTDTGVDISQSGAGRGCNITVQNLHINSPGNGQTTINNHISGFTAGGFINVPLYVYGGDGTAGDCGTDLLPATFDSLEVDMLDRAGHKTWTFPIPSAFSGPQFRSFFDGALDFNLDAGATAPQQENIDFNDRGTGEWQLGKDPSQNFRLQDQVNSFKTHIQFQQTSGTPEISIWRMGGKLGTTETTGQVGTLTGWGTGPSVSAASGTDNDFSFTITSGTAPSAQPTAIFTFKDGAFGNSPICILGRADNTATVYNWSAISPTTTTVTILFVGTPAASTAYTVNGMCGAR